AGAAQALARCADDGAAVFDTEIHCFTPVSAVFFEVGAATVANIDGPDKAQGLPQNLAPAEIAGINARISRALRNPPCQTCSTSARKPF
ncbi:hypothetical protein, partial [Bradyrhizobium sp.]|uniref:hypothetical protein n=1 Tax=Bradyrhizobium sp. TaxID=376 RepID=UPI003C714CDD